ncbi:SDR family oxidoreductase [Variovorax defluvii]|uniref:SDR family oxidoreductase n=1 Tax=Variovorax defluvii TaxID=913761 RepID=A0ABP8I8S5_9BURK
MTMTTPNPTHQWLELDDEVCVVTGASGGIGASVVRELLQAGARVALLDSNAGGVTELAQQLDPAGVRTLALGCDVTDADTVQRAVDAVEGKFGTAGVLVNNAGIIRPGNLATISIEDWRSQLEVNLTGYFRCAQLFGRGMLARRRGVMIHVASITARNPQVRGGAYAPAKAAISMLSRQIAIEWGPDGVRSNTVSPGLIRTPMTEASYSDPELVEKRRSLIPVQRLGVPEDIAHAVLYLASPKSAYVNGQDLAVDGGVTQTLMSHIPRADHGRGH